jgi:hypothetical protein
LLCYVEPLRSHCHDFMKLEYIVKKQQVGGGGHLSTTLIPCSALLCCDGKSISPSLSAYMHIMQYLEALSWQGALDCPPELAPWRPLRPIRHQQNREREGEGEDEEEVDMDQVVAVLKSLEPLCSQQVIDSALSFLAPSP